MEQPGTKLEQTPPVSGARQEFTSHRNGEPYSCNVLHNVTKDAFPKNVAARNSAMNRVSLKASGLKAFFKSMI
jgi:hypothetical protein